MKLKKKVEWILSIATLTLFLIGVSVDYLELRAIPLYIGLWLVVVVNVYLIRRYGRGVIYERD